MNLIDIINRTSPPEPWSEGDNIPWNEPGFSQRMLKEHLTQDHDMASRKLVNIERHVAWIHTRLLEERPSCILDLGCGPGLYMEKLAKLGHTCTGVDFSPASLAYARETAAREHLACTYIEGDLREADYGADGSYDLAMQIFGETNIFRPKHLRLILKKVYLALKPGGKLLLEVHHEQFVRRLGAVNSSWYSAPSGLFSDRPHVVLEEVFWDEELKTATTRFYVIGAESGEVQRFASALQAYTEDEYRQALESCGFGNIRFYPSLAGDENAQPGDMIAITASK
jgi:SAM-dependent methyltransferase